MKEAFFILLILAVLLGLTLFRYRKQVLTLWRVWQTVKGIRSAPGVNAVVNELRVA